MDTFNAFVRGFATMGQEKRVFDWDKAAKIIREHTDMDAFAGLSEDLEWTGGWIYKNGEIVGGTQQ